MARLKAPDGFPVLLARLAEGNGGHQLGAALTRLGALEEGVFAAELHVSLPALACALSCFAGGQWIAGGSGLTWVNGRQVRYLLSWGQVERVRECRRVAEGLGVPCASWTAGGVARALLKWVGIRYPHRRGQDPWLLECPWAYRAVTPGASREASLCDLDAAYWQALCRLPSPHVDWLTVGPCWHPLLPAEEERWRAVLAGVGGCKPLRLCLVGCMAGGGVGGVTYHRGRRLPVRRQRGPLYTAARVVVRAVYELTWLAASEEGALLANTDAVILPEHRRPRAWERLGYPYKVEAEGAADIIHLASYRVGQRQTAPYGAGARYPIPESHCPPPSRPILGYWH